MDYTEERKAYFKALDESIRPQEEYEKMTKAQLIEEIYRLIRRSPSLSLWNLHRWKKSVLLSTLVNIRKNGVEAYDPYAPGYWI